MINLFINYYLILNIFYLIINGENNSSFSNDNMNNDNKYLNNFKNMSNTSRELSDYDIDGSLESISDGGGGVGDENNDDDDVSVPPEIYPDPENFYSHRKSNNNLIQWTTIGTITATERNNNNVNEVQSSAITSITTIKNYSDFKEHDFIDNIMYIYYDTNVTTRKNLGGNIIIVGAVFALAAQILSIVIPLLNSRPLRNFNFIARTSLRLLIALFLSNFIFIIGVLQASKNHKFKCELISIILHYFHLATSLWGLTYIYIIYDFVINNNFPNLKLSYILTYCGAGFYVLFSFIISSESYENIDYCWMSVQRGMIINFMIPISILIVATTIFGTLALKEISSKHRDNMVRTVDDFINKLNQESINLHGNNNCNNNNINYDKDFTSMVKCCDEMISKVCDVDLEHADFYDSKFDLGALSMADLSLHSSSNEEQPSDFPEIKKALKFALFFQPAYSVCWFLGVVALENRQTCIMPIVFIVCFNILNWYILYNSSNITPKVIVVNNANLSSLAKQIKAHGHHVLFKNINNNINYNYNSNNSIAKHLNNIDHNQQQHQQYQQQQLKCPDTIPLLYSDGTFPIQLSPSLSSPTLSEAAVPSSASSSSITSISKNNPKNDGIFNRNNHKFNKSLCLERSMVTSPTATPIMETVTMATTTNMDNINLEFISVIN